jgi:hypothetical protein
MRQRFVSKAPSIAVRGEVSRIVPCRGWDTSLQGGQLLTRVKISAEQGYNMVLPIGILTPTNSPFCSAGPTESIVLPRAMPTPMATMIQTTKKRSRKESPLSGGSSFLASCSTVYEVSCRIWKTILLYLRYVLGAVSSTSFSRPVSRSVSLLRASLSCAIAPRSTVSMDS